MRSPQYFCMCAMSLGWKLARRYQSSTRVELRRSHVKMKAMPAGPGGWRAGAVEGRVGGLGRRALVGAHKCDPQLTIHPVPTRWSNEGDEG